MANETGHSRANNFINSCVKIPLDPISKMPSPGYERRPATGLTSTPNRASRASSASGPRSRVSSATKYRPSSSSIGKREIFGRPEESVTASLGPLMSFYESIPDYSELGHLPDREFYAKVRELRETQREHVSQLVHTPSPDPQRWTAGVQGVRCVLNESRGQTPIPCSPSSSARSAWGRTGSITPSPRRRTTSANKSQRSRAPSGPSPAPRVNSARRSRVSSVWDEEDSWEDALLLLSEEDADEARPSRLHKNVAWREPQFTVPKPFTMTQREEDERYYALLRQELLRDSDYSRVSARTPSPPRRHHEVPLTSRIPLFHGILLQQELRREREKRRSKARLLSQIRPFSFDLGHESPAMRLARTRTKLWQSSPELRDLHRVRGGGEFRAKPMPRHLYGMEAMMKRQEEEFLRLLRRRVRAEETLRDASLPPSMTSRTLLSHPPCLSGASPQDSHSQPRRQLSAPLSKSSGGSRRSHAVSPDSRLDGCSPYEVAFTEAPRRRRPHSGSVSPIRNNLAAVLRIESCRRRAEREAALRLEQRRSLEEARARARVLRRRPAWRHMQQVSTRRDLALRTEARREEELSRQHEHSRFMGRMMGRVLGIPTLFERQTMQAARLRRDIDTSHQTRQEPRSPPVCRSPTRNKFVTPPVETHISFCPGTRSGDSSCGSGDEEKRDEPEFAEKKDEEQREEKQDEDRNVATPCTEPRCQSHETTQKSQSLRN